MKIKGSTFCGKCGKSINKVRNNNTKSSKSSFTITPVLTSTDIRENWYNLNWYITKTKILATYNKYYNIIIF